MIENIIVKLADYIKQYDKVAVVIDSDVNSSILLNAAVSALGSKNVLAIIPHNEFTPEARLETSKRICTLADVDYVTTAVFLTDEPLTQAASPLKCYYCQRLTYREIIHEAWLKGIQTVFSSVCKNDSRDCIAGLLAITELSVVCPFIETDIDESEIIGSLNIEGSIPRVSCSNMQE